MRNIIAAIILLTVGLVQAAQYEFTLWRGETFATRIPDNAELGPVPAGIDARVGVLKGVKYAPEAGSLRRYEVCDRVKWGSDDSGPRVVEIVVPRDAKPGVYQWGMLTIRVIDRVMPPAKEWKYYLDLWQNPWAVARIAKAEPFSKRHYDAMRPVWELLASAGQKTITISMIDKPWDHQCRDAYHSMFEDGNFRLFDEYVEFCRSCGLGPDISCYSLCPWTLGKTIDEAALEKRWGDFLDRFARHLKEKGWFANTLMSMDERAPEDVAKVVAFVRRHAPGMRIAMAGNRKPSDFRGITIDVYSQVLIADMLTPAFLEEARERRAKGLVTTQYVCCGPARPNTFMDSPEGEPFWCGVSPAFLGLDGFLRWAWNSWPQDPKEDATYGEWRSGDTFLCYPGGAPSGRFLELRNGITAAEKVRILREQGLYADELNALAKRFSVAEANGGKCDFRKIRDDVLRAVNRP